jgi:hypothetical protein
MTDNGTSVTPIATNTTPGTYGYTYSPAGITAPHELRVAFVPASDGFVLPYNQETHPQMSIVDVQQVLLLALKDKDAPRTPAEQLAALHGDVAPLVDGKPAPNGIINVGDVVVLLRKLVGLVSW